MGVGIFSRSSFSSYDKTSKDSKLPNPNPKNFKIVKKERINKFLIVEINYPDCTNFEGNKILVYKDIEVLDLLSQGELVGLDPHFSDNQKYHSPIARFIPNQYGWELARKICI